MIKSVEKFTYCLDGKEYLVILTRKRMRTIQYRFKDGNFLISAPGIVSKSTILNGLDKFAPKLIKRCTKQSAFNDDGVYVFGDKQPFNIINIDNKEIDLSDKENIPNVLKKLLLQYVTEKVGFYSSQMNIGEDYKIKVRDTKTRLGSNSRRTKTLAFSLSLIHFSKEIIDSVIVHELAHCKVFNHSKDFYNVVYQHCPNYNVYRKKLIHSEFK